MEKEHSSAYSISDLESLSGVKAHTIRIWEKRYKVFTPRRTDTNIRYYSNEDLKKLLNISLLLKNGLKISELSVLPAAGLAEKVSSILLPETDSRNERLLMSLLEMDEVLFSRVFENMVKREGFERTIIDTVFPFFQRVGLMWQCGTINPAQEHFFSTWLNQRLFTPQKRCAMILCRGRKLLYCSCRKENCTRLLCFFTIMHSGKEGTRPYTSGNRYHSRAWNGYLR